jgi:hypothetical protein
MTEDESQIADVFLSRQTQRGPSVAGTGGASNYAGSARVTVGGTSPIRVAEMGVRRTVAARPSFVGPMVKLTYGSRCCAVNVVA